MEYFQVSGPLYQLLGFKHVAGYDFSPSPAVINRIKEDSKKNSATEIIFKPIYNYPTVAVIKDDRVFLMYRSSVWQNFVNPFGKFSSKIIDCSLKFQCVVQKLIGIVRRKFSFGDFK